VPCRSVRGHAMVFNQASTSILILEIVRNLLTEAAAEMRTGSSPRPNATASANNKHSKYMYSYKTNKK